MIIKRGSTGSTVTVWQNFLTNIGHSVGGIDGKFGPKTESATKQFQQSCGLVADGIVGERTFAEAALCGFKLSEIPVTTELSKNALALIYEFEVGGGRDYYEKFLMKPTIPGGDSGVTIGIGYDLGYNTDSTIRKDWGAFVDSATLEKLCSVAGKTRAGKSDIEKVEGVVIPWEIAEQVFQQTTVTKFVELTKQTFPGAAEKLPADAFGALVSLVFNRGGSLTGSRRLQMLHIRQWLNSDLTGKDLQNMIADEIMAMIPLWHRTTIETGMTRRRFSEAKLIREA